MMLYEEKIAKIMGRNPFLSRAGFDTYGGGGMDHEVVLSQSLFK